MIGPLSAKGSARSSLSAERVIRVLGLDSRSTTVAALLPRYAADTPFPEMWGGHRTAVSASLSAAAPCGWQGPGRCIRLNSETRPNRSRATKQPAIWR